jgi:hypothetical protein
MQRDAKAREWSVQMSSDPRYTIFAARAVFDNRLSATEVRVLAALGSYSDRQGWCRPSRATIAERIGSSRSRVSASVKRLSSFGYIQVVQQETDRGFHTVNLYRVLIDMITPEAIDEAANGAEILVFPQVSNGDHPPSPLETTPYLAAQPVEETQQAPPVVSNGDHPPSPLETTPVSIGDPKREHSHKNIQEKKRASRLPPTWTPRSGEVQFGILGGLSEPEVLACAEHMRDWAASSPKAVKLDWDRAFRNWLRTAIGDAKRGRRPVVAASGDAEHKRRLWVFSTYGEWRADWGPTPIMVQEN